MGENMELKVTSLEDLKKVAQGEIVELPPFVEGEKFVARLKRPSMLALAKAGKIPNDLLVEANTLFTTGTAQTAAKNSMDENMMKDMCSILDVICEHSLVEPTIKQLEEIGLDLTDEQKLFVFTYSQRGVEAIKSFREER